MKTAENIKLIAQRIHDVADINNTEQEIMVALEAQHRETWARAINTVRGLYHAGGGGLWHLDEQFTSELRQLPCPPLNTKESV